MNLTKFSIDTMVTEIPRIINANNKKIIDRLDLIYDKDRGVIIVPINTTNVTATNGVFDSIRTKNLTITNPDNIAKIDTSYVTVHNDRRDVIRPFKVDENPGFSYIDVDNKYFYKISNDVSTAFATKNIGTEIHILFDKSSESTDPYNILIDPSTFNVMNTSGIKKIKVTAADSETAWIKLVAVKDIPGFGIRWAIKEFGGNITLN